MGVEGVDRRLAAQLSRVAGRMWRLRFRGKRIPTLAELSQLTAGGG